jgi:hypothetical protein
MKGVLFLKLQNKILLKLNYTLPKILSQLSQANPRKSVQSVAKPKGSAFSVAPAKSAGKFPVFCHFCTFSRSAQSLTIPYKLNKFLQHGKDYRN